MKNLFMILSLMTLVACNSAGGGDNTSSNTNNNPDDSYEYIPDETVEETNTIIVDSLDYFNTTQSSNLQDWVYFDSSGCINNDPTLPSLDEIRDNFFNETNFISSSQFINQRICLEYLALELAGYASSNIYGLDRRNDLLDILEANTLDLENNTLINAQEAKLLELIFDEL